MYLICACIDDKLKTKIKPMLQRVVEINHILHKLNDIDEELADKILAGAWELLPEREKYNKLSNR